MPKDQRRFLFWGARKRFAENCRKKRPKPVLGMGIIEAVLNRLRRGHCAKDQIPRVAVIDWLERMCDNRFHICSGRNVLVCQKNIAIIPFEANDCSHVEKAGRPLRCVHVSTASALTQVEEATEQSHWHLCMRWPTCADVQQTKTCKLVNLSEHRYGAHMDANYAWIHRGDSLRQPRNKNTLASFRH